MSPQPQTPAQPTQPTMAANVPRKRSLQSTLDAFLKPNPVVTDDGSDAIVQLTGSPTQPKVASHVFSLLALVEGTTVCLEIPLQSPPSISETAFSHRFRKAYTYPPPKGTTFWYIRPKVEKNLKKCEFAPCWHLMNVPERYVTVIGFDIMAMFLWFRGKSSTVHIISKRAKWW